MAPNEPPASNGNPMSNPSPLSSRAAAGLLVLFTGLMVPAAWFFQPGWSYATLMGLMILFMIVLGLKICGRPAGILINDQNLMSLSRFQMILWTVLILSAFLTLAIQRIHSKTPDALAITLQKELWALLGISTASLVGTTLTQSNKKAQEPKDEALEQASKSLSEDKKEISKNSQGLLYANAGTKDAAFSDLFEGDEVGNCAYIDVAKVQMFFFTIIAALSYGAALFGWLLRDAVNNPVFPPLPTGLIAILGISHAGFLGSQATPKTPTA